MESHLVFARKYRPNKFSEVVCQEVPVGAIQNAIKNNRVGHAYIFFGPRGVGKTTIARILAKRLNCQNPKETEPCNECQSCVEITKGVSNDVVEIDAASNRSIDDVRELREGVKFNAMGGKYRIFIIDEVHMLTTQAFNALLKTLEEPPRHVVFVLATTDQHKVPDTILSRCQDFVFKKVPIIDLQDHIERLAKTENLTYDSEGLFWIAKKGDGSVRDTLSFLEQVVTFTGGKLTGENLKKILGLRGVTQQIEFSKFLLSDESSTKAIEFLEKEFSLGSDLQKFIWEYLDFIHTTILVRENIYDKESINFTSEDVSLIQKEMQNFRMETLNLLAERFFQIYERVALLRLRSSYETKLYLEIQVRKLVSDLNKPTVSGLVAKIFELSQMIQKDINHLPAEKPKSAMTNEGIEPIQKTSDLDLEAGIKNTFSGVEVDENFPQID
ncbi:MAG: DNA polymerase III subunit gamma/tau [Leptospiraceae bacterium]|nr:DNA polymerase III subunit gamma/tau [Leptospiraceae bacterium]